VTVGPTQVDQGQVIEGVRPGAIAAVPAVRRVRVAVTRVDPWTVMKLALVLSVALAVVLVVSLRRPMPYVNRPRSSAKKVVSWTRWIT